MLYGCKACGSQLRGGGGRVGGHISSYEFLILKSSKGMFFVQINIFPKKMDGNANGWELESL